MKYRVGKKQNRVILNEHGRVVAECLKGNEILAQHICDLLNNQSEKETQDMLAKTNKNTKSLEIDKKLAEIDEKTNKLDNDNTEYFTYFKKLFNYLKK